MEGRANAFTVEIERKFHEMFRVFTEEMRIAEVERRNRVAEINGEIKDEIVKIKGEAQRRDILMTDKED